MKRIFIISILFITFLFPITAERLNTKTEYFNRAIGGKFSALPDSFIGGMTYQQWFENDLGIEGTVGFIANENSAHYNFEIQLQKLLFVNDFGERNNSALYLWANTGVNSYEVEKNAPEGADYDSVTYIKPSIFVGTGLGIELTYFEHVAIPVTIGFEAEFLGRFAVGFTAGIGLRYRF
ncbi:MAG: hypothetical protein IJ293_04480 [Treponema sp.]|nr:hypothetical protein [Treponema sp.]